MEEMSTDECLLTLPKNLIKQTTGHAKKQIYSSLNAIAHVRLHTLRRAYVRIYVMMAEY